MRRLARFGIITWTVTLAGCGSGSGSIGPTSVTGTYTLQSVNGNALPVLLTSGNAQQRILNGQFSLHSNGTYGREETMSVATSGGNVLMSASDSGTYNVTGAAVALRSNSGGTMTATVDGGRFTLAFFGDSYLYVK